MSDSTTSTTDTTTSVAATKRPAKGSVIDALAEDAAPPEYPPGSPLLRPYLQIRPRSLRAQFKRKFAEFSEAQNKIDEIKGSGVLEESSGQSDRLRAWADLDDMYQQMDDLMQMAAVNPDAYREWSDTVEDNDLVSVFNVFMKRTQPGEASSSAS